MFLGIPNSDGGNWETVKNRSVSPKIFQVTFQFPLNSKSVLRLSRCQAKFLTCEISDFTPCTHAQSNIVHTKYADKTDY